MKNRVKIKFTGVIDWDLGILLRIILKQPVEIELEEHEAEIEIVKTLEE